MNSETKLYGIKAVLEAIEANKSLERFFYKKGLKGYLYFKLEKKNQRKKSKF